jgi:hypothetical protein
MTHATWNHAVEWIELLGDVLLLGSVLFVACAAVWALGCLIGG